MIIFLFLYYKRVLRLAAITLANLDGPILNKVRLLWVQHYIGQILCTLAVYKILLLWVLLVLLSLLYFHLCGVHNKGDKCETSASTGILVSHDGDIDELSDSFKIIFDIRF